MSGLGDNLKHYLHPAGKASAARAAAKAKDESEVVDSPQEEAVEPIGAKLGNRLKPGMFKLKPKAPEEQAEHDTKAKDEVDTMRTRGGLVGSRG